MDIIQQGWQVICGHEKYGVDDCVCSETPIWEDMTYIQNTLAKSLKNVCMNKPISAPVCTGEDFSSS